MATGRVGCPDREVGLYRAACPYRAALLVAALATSPSRPARLNRRLTNCATDKTWSKPAGHWRRWSFRLDSEILAAVAAIWVSFPDRRCAYARR
jgi:hypothetical protein